MEWLPASGFTSLERSPNGLTGLSDPEVICGRGEYVRSSMSLRGFTIE